MSWWVGLGVAIGVVVLLMVLSVYFCGWDGFLSKISTLCGINFERFEKRFVFEQAQPDKHSEFLVVAFAGGALRLGGLPQEEFRRTLESINRSTTKKTGGIDESEHLIVDNNSDSYNDTIQCDHLFLIDPLQSFYLNDPTRQWKGYEYYSAGLRKYTQNYPGKALFIGNCMGGAGCLLFADLSDACLLFNPIVDLEKNPDWIQRVYAKRYFPSSVRNEFAEIVARNLSSNKISTHVHFSTGKKHTVHEEAMRRCTKDKTQYFLHEAEGGAVQLLKRQGKLVPLIREQLIELRNKSS